MSVQLPTRIEGKLWVVVEPTGFGQYDFKFEDFFECRHPYQLDGDITAIARMGATQNYPGRYSSFEEFGINLIHTPNEYLRTSVLPEWYPLIEEFTPRSMWFKTPPAVEKIEACFEWPVFVKGERQTSKHDGALSIIHSPEQYSKLKSNWESNPILWWQRMVVREFRKLAPAETYGSAEPMPKSFEFRTFWWRKRCVGIGRYWVAANYEIGREDEESVRTIGSRVAARIDVPFLVIDFAKTVEGEWIVIECNDGQDSGYAGVNPRMMWSRILEIEGA